MDWIIYATSAILHVWGAFNLCYVGYLFNLIKESGMRVKSVSIKPLFFIPFIGLVFFYSWVLFG